MNRGAAVANGKILWFVHADSRVRAGSVESISAAIRDGGAVGGAMRFRLDRRRWFGPLLEAAVRLRCRLLRMPYGDQGFFVERRCFRRIGGFREIPVLEDVDFFRRLKREGSVAMLPVSLETSVRRWDREGFFWTTLRNWGVVLAFVAGVSPDRLARWYPPEPAEVAGGQSPRFGR